MSNTGIEQCNAIENFIGYLKGKEIKGITIKNPKIPKVVMFCKSS